MRKLEGVQEDGVISIPQNIYSQIRSETLVADVVFMNDVTFMVAMP